MRCRIDDPHRSWVASLVDRTNPTTRRVLAEELLGLVRRSGQCSQPPSGTPAPFERQPLIGVQPSLCREPTFSCDNTSGGRPLRGARGPMSAHPEGMVKGPLTGRSPSSFFQPHRTGRTRTMDSCASPGSTHASTARTPGQSGSASRDRQQ